MVVSASVVICTYNRPALFEAALRSCLRDATRRALRFEIVVADNSREGHAAAIVARVLADAAPRDAVPGEGAPGEGAPGEGAVRVIPVAPPNISLARNAGLRAAAAPLVAFMDDDLEVEPGWLDALVDVLAATGADVALGPVRPLFPAGSPPDWDPTGARFTRVLTRPTGSPVAASGPAKPANFAVSTASSIWRVATCFSDAEPFDPAFGACGGEDLDLFLRLERRGRRIVWCAEAGVRETVPPGRMRLGYHQLRVYSGAQVYSAATLKNARSRPAALLSLALRGLAQSVAFGLAALALAPAARWSGPRHHASLRRHATRMTFAALGGWGKLTWWRRVRLYHVERPTG